MNKELQVKVVEALKRLSFLCSLEVLIGDAYALDTDEEDYKKLAEEVNSLP